MVFCPGLDKLGKSRQRLIVLNFLFVKTFTLVQDDLSSERECKKRKRRI
jgi:hypothetical protein